MLNCSEPPSLTGHTHTVNSCRSGDVIFLRPMSSETFDTSNNLPCVCSEKEDSVTISDMDLDCVLQKREIEIFSEQSPPLSLDKIYPFPQMLVNSLNSAKRSMCRAHEISCTSESWLQTAKQEHSETFDISVQCSSVFTSTGFSFDIRKVSQKRVYWWPSPFTRMLGKPQHIFCSHCIWQYSSQLK